MAGRNEALDSQGRRRVLVTGLNAVGPGKTGLNSKDVFESMVVGRSGVDFLRAIDDKGNEIQGEFDKCSVRIGGQVPILDLTNIMSLKDQKRNHEVSHLSVFATHGALTSAELLNRNGRLKFKNAGERLRYGEVIGSAASGTSRIALIQYIIESRGESKVGPLESLKILAERPGVILCKIWDIRGPNFLPVSACQTGGASVFIGTELIRGGRYDVMIAGGVDSPMPLTSPIETHFSKSLFSNLALTRFDGRPYEGAPENPAKVSVPFDFSAQGFVMSGGAGVLILEDYEHATRRGAPVYGEIVGTSVTNDGKTAQSDTLSSGEGSITSMRLSLKDAGIRPKQVGLVVAHATSTPDGDLTEKNAIKTVFRNSNELSITAPKSIVGHLLGASGGFGVWLALKSINEGIITPTINLKSANDPDLDFTPNAARHKQVEYAQSNSFGFGNGCSTITVKKYSPPRWV